MIYLLKAIDNVKKTVESNSSIEKNVALSKISSLNEKRDSLSQIKAREKVLNASSKIKW